MNILKKIFAAAALMLTAGAVAGNLSAQDSTAAVREEAPRHWDFTLEDVIVMAQSKSLPALVARYSFISSYFLPSLNLGADIGQYNRSIVALQDAETGETHYVQNDNMNNSLQLSIDQNIPFTGGTVSLNTYLNRFDQFSPFGDMTYNSNPVNIAYYQPIFQYNRLKWESATRCPSACTSRTWRASPSRPRPISSTYSASRRASRWPAAATRAHSSSTP